MLSMVECGLRIFNKELLLSKAFSDMSFCVSVIEIALLKVIKFTGKAGSSNTLPFFPK
jgi:hypothetical protein